MRNSKAKTLRRIYLTYRAKNMTGPDKDLSYNQLKCKFRKGVPLGLTMLTPRHELVRQGNWLTHAE